MLVFSTTISNNTTVTTLKSIAEVSYLLKVVQRILIKTNDHKLSYLSFSKNMQVELAHYLLRLDR